MTINELKSILKQGEDSQHQFKNDFTNPTSIATEMAAFSNSMGGTLYIGISDK